MATLTDLYNGVTPPPTYPGMRGGSPDPAAGTLGLPDPAAGIKAPTDPAGGGQAMSLNDWYSSNPWQYELGDPRSLPPGFTQSSYWPQYQSVLAQYKDAASQPYSPDSTAGQGLGDWLRNSLVQYAAGRSPQDWLKPTSEANLIGGLSSTDVGQLALGGFGGAAMGAGVGGGGTAAAGGAAPAAVGGAAPTLGQAGTAASLAGTAANTLGDSQAVSPPLGATQDPLGSGGDPGNAVSGPGASGGAAGAGSALSHIIDGTATTADLTSVLGGLAGTGLGIAGSISQQHALQDLADKQMAMGAPYRDRLASLYADPNSFLKSAEVTTPVQQGTDALARSLSVQGNPIGSGHALQELQDYSANQLFGKLGQEKDRLAGYGGLTAYNAAAPGTALAGVNAGSNVWNAVGSGVANLTNPQPSLIDIFKSMKGLA